MEGSALRRREVQWRQLCLAADRCPSGPGRTHGEPEGSHRCCASRLGEDGVGCRTGQLDHYGANQREIPVAGAQVVRWRVLQADRDCLSRAHHHNPERGISAVPQNVPPGNHRRLVRARHRKSNTVSGTILINGAGYGSFFPLRPRPKAACHL